MKAALSILAVLGIFFGFSYGLQLIDQAVARSGLPATDEPAVRLGAGIAVIVVSSWLTNALWNRLHSRRE